METTVVYRNILTKDEIMFDEYKTENHFIRVNDNGALRVINIRTNQTVAFYNSNVWIRAYSE